MAEKDGVLTSSDDDEMEDLSDSVMKRLQCLCERSVKKLIGDESMNVEEILCRSLGIGEEGGCKGQSVCPNVTLGGDLGADDRRFSPGEEINQISRKVLGSANITSTPKRAAVPLYTKRGSSVLSD